MPEEGTLSASSRPSKLHSHTNIYTTYKCNPKTIKRKERRMDDGPFCEISYTAGDNRVRKRKTRFDSVQQAAGGDVLKRVLGESLHSGDQPKLTSESTLTVATPVGKLSRMSQN